MPIYEYQCSVCGHQEAEIESFTAPRTKKCPSCGKRTFTRLISAAAFHLKGGGWYATDFRDKAKSKDAKTADDDKSSAADKTEKTEQADKTEKSDQPKKEGGDDKKSSAKAEKKGADKKAE